MATKGGPIISDAIGSGPIVIGQACEFDYSGTQACKALRSLGYEIVLVNSNPATIMTDYDTSDKLYFEPLTVEDVLSIYEKEKPQGVIVQFGGQTPLNLAAELAAAGVKILGTSHETIELAEDRDRFRQLMRKLGIPQPESGMANSFGLAFYKAQEATGLQLPLEGTVLITVADRDKPAVQEVARRFAELGFRIKATTGAKVFLAEHGIDTESIVKMREGRPNIADAIIDGDIQLVINTPRGKASKADDAYIRQTAIRCKVPYVTTLAAAKGIAACRNGRAPAKSLQDYHADIQ